MAIALTPRLVEIRWVIPTPTNQNDSKRAVFVLYHFTFTK